MKLFIFHFSFFILHFSSFAQTASLIPFQNEGSGLWGYKSANGKTVKIKPQFREAFDFELQRAKVKAPQGCFLINKKGKTISNFYDFIGWGNDEKNIFQSEITAFRKQHLWGILDKDGNELLKAQFLAVRWLGYSRFAAQNKNQLWTIYDNFGKPILKTQFEEIKGFHAAENKIQSIVIKNLHYGIIDATGKIITPFIYKEIAFVDDEFIKLSFPKWELTDSTGKVLNTFYFDDLENIGKNIFAFKLKKHKGLINSEGEELVLNKYDNIASFDKKRKLSIVEKEGKFGIINLKIKEILSPKYDKISFENDEIISTFLNGKELFFDLNGKQINLEQYDIFERSSQGFFKVQKNGLWGILDSNLQPLIQCKYVFLGVFQGNFIAAKRQKDFGILSQKEEWVISPILDSTAVLNENTFIYWENNRWGTLNKNGIELYQGMQSEKTKKWGKNLIITKQDSVGLIAENGFLKLPIRYDSIAEQRMGNIIYVYQNGKKLPMNITKSALPTDSIPTYVSILGNPSEDFFPAKIYDGFGFVDYLGRMRIANQYEKLGVISESLVAVKLGKHWGVISKYEKLIIQPYYDSFTPFKNGRSIVKQKGKYGLASKDGRFPIPIEYDKLEETPYGNWRCYQKGKIGVLSDLGQGGIYPKYDFLQDLGNGFVISRKDGFYGLDAFSGFNIIFHKYDNIKYNSHDNTYFVISN